MDPGLASWNFLLHLLLLCAYRGGARMTIERKQWGDDLDVQRRVLGEQEAMNDHRRIQTNQEVRTKDAHDHPSSFMDQIEHSIFFTIDALAVGKILPTYFPSHDPFTSPPLLPREEADSIPFSLKELPQLLQLFSFSHDSPQAKVVEDTIRMCEGNPMKGETKYCPTSLESMLDFARKIFGLETKFKVLSTTYLTKSATDFQNYTILQVPKEIYAPKMIACHPMSYPYAIFYCHSQSENKLFQVLLGSEDGDRVEAVAVCHMDTSQWSPEHVSFRILGTKPGKNSHVCHLFLAEGLVFVPEQSTY